MDRSSTPLQPKPGSQEPEKGDDSKTTRKLTRLFSRDELPLNIEENADMTDETSIIYWSKPSSGEDPRLKTGAARECLQEALFEISSISETSNLVKIQLKDLADKVLAANFSEELGPHPFFEMISLKDPDYDPTTTVYEFSITNTNDSKYISLKIAHPQDKGRHYYWHVNDTTSDIELRPSDENAMVFLTRELECLHV